MFGGSQFRVLGFEVFFLGGLGCKALGFDSEASQLKLLVGGSWGSVTFAEGLWSGSP